MRWPERRLGMVARLRVSNVDKLSRDDGTPVRLCNYVDVYKNEAITNDLDFMQATATPAQIASFRLSVGDTIFTKDSETADDIGVPTYVTETSDDLICGYHLAIATPDRTKVDPRFLFWAMSSGRVRDQWTVLASGVTRVGLRRDDLGKAGIPVPPLDEQRRIADFLDTETARVDRVVSRRERQSALLAERTALHWQHIIDDLAGAERVPLRRFLRSISDGPFGSSLKSSHYSTDGARVIRLGNVGTAEFIDQDQVFIPLGYYEELRAHSVRPGDVVVAGLGDSSRPVGRACLVPDLGPAIVKADCFRLRFDQSRLLHEYAAVAISAPAVTSQTSTLSRGSTRIRINTDVAREIAIPVPPLDSQRQVVVAISEMRTENAGLRSAFADQVSQLRERRQALITAAVTGQLDVTTFRGVAS